MSAQIGQPAAGASPSTDDEHLSYSDALTELDTILAELHSDRVDVDHLGTQVRRAAALIALCRSRIVAARLEITDATQITDAPATETTGGPDDAGDTDVPSEGSSVG